MRFARPTNGVIEISRAVKTRFRSFRQIGKRQRESGGVLLGRIILETNNVVVDEITSPSLCDLRRRFSFFRARSPAQQRVNRAWSQSSRTVNYLGEWHTHPEDHPAPSGHDFKEWIRISHEAQFEQDFLCFIIVGRISICVWELPKKAIGCGQLKPCLVQT